MDRRCQWFVLWLLATSPMVGCLLGEHGVCRSTDVCDASVDCGQPCPASCDDGLSCTEDTCVVETGECAHDLAIETCLIAGACLVMGERAPEDVCLLCAPTRSQASWTDVCTSSWVESSYADFIDGRFQDGGVNLYAAAAGNVQRIERGDLDDDGHLDIVLTSYFDDVSRRTNSFIYWGGAGRDYGVEQRTGLPTQGCVQASVADLNDDSHPDLVFCNQFDDTTFDISSYVYWGSAAGYDESRRSDLPAPGCGGSAVADLNRDGYLDIAFSSSYGAGSHHTMSSIYWGSAEGFDPARRTVLPTLGAAAVSIADVNADGYLDVLFTNHYDGVSSSISSYLYWGSAAGFDAASRLELPTYGATGNSIADVDADGHLDVVFANYAAPSSIYWGSPDGIDVTTPSLLPTAEMHDVSVADLDADGYLDLVFSSHMAAGLYATRSPVFWGSASGLAPEARVDVPTVGPIGNLVNDFDGDGFLDVLFTSYYNGVSFSTTSLLYWGSGFGYTSSRRLELPTNGGHYCVTRDPGNVFDRGPREVYVSSVHDASAPSRFSRIFWTATVPDGTSLSLQLRSADTRDGLGEAPWLGPTDADDAYRTSPSAINPAHYGYRWIQYRAVFESPDAARSPVLDEVRIDYDGLE